MGIGMVINLSTKADGFSVSGKGVDTGKSGKSIRRRDVYVIALLLVACLSLGAYVGLTYSPPEQNFEEQFGSGGWLNVSYHYRLQLKIENTNTIRVLPMGYPIAVIIEYPSLVSDGKLRGDFTDLRIAFQSGNTITEIPRNTEIQVNSTHITLYFQLAEPIAPSKATYSYSIYYGNPVADSPPVSDFNIVPAKQMNLQLSFWHEEKVPEFALLPVLLSMVTFVIIVTLVKIRGRFR